MAQKKDTKKNVKVRDLAPKKDAKGGGGKGLDGGKNLDGGRSLDGGRNLDGGRSLDGSRGSN